MSAATTTAVQAEGDCAPGCTKHRTCPTSTDQPRVERVCLSLHCQQHEHVYADADAKPEAAPNSIYARMARAFHIFDSYGDPNEQDISAEHYEIYAGPDPEVVSPEHLVELEQLGWHADDGNGTFCRFA